MPAIWCSSEACERSSLLMHTCDYVCSGSKCFLTVFRITSSYRSQIVSEHGVIGDYDVTNFSEEFEGEHQTESPQRQQKHHLQKQLHHAAKLHPPILQSLPHQFPPQILHRPTQLHLPSLKQSN